jgi:hypothetical protein
MPDALSSRHYLESMTLLWAFSYSQQQGPVSSNDNNPLPSLASLEWRARILKLSAPEPTVPVLYTNDDNLLDMIHPDIVDFF